MARNAGGDGAGFSKPILSAEEQNRIRRAKKKARKLNHNNGAQPTVPLLQAVLDDRAAARAERDEFLAKQKAARAERDKRRNEENKLSPKDRAFSRTMSHLTRFGEQEIPKRNATMGPRWSPEALEAAELLLRLYIYGPLEEAAAQEQITGASVKDEVRRRLAGTCYLLKLTGIVAEELYWYADAAEKAKRYHDGRHIAKTAARAATTSPTPVTDAPATTVETPADADTQPVMATA